MSVFEVDDGVLRGAKAHANQGATGWVSVTGRMIRRWWGEGKRRQGGLVTAAATAKERGDEEDGKRDGEGQRQDNRPGRVLRVIGFFL